MAKVRAVDNSGDIDAAQERMLLLLCFKEYLPTKDAGQTRLSICLVAYGKRGNALFLRAVLARMQSPYVRLDVLRPLSADRNLIEKIYSHGELNNSTTFQLVEAKNRWLGLN